MASSSSQSVRTAKKGKDTVDSSNLNSKNDEECKVASGAEDIEENAIKEFASEENGKDDNDEKIESEEEMDVGANLVEEENYEQNAIEEDDNELDATGEEEDNNEEVTAGEEEEEEEEREGDEDKEEEKVGEEVNVKETEKEVTEQPKPENAVGQKSSEKGKKKRIRKKKRDLTGSGTVTTEREGKPESSEKTKVSKRAESMGMIFMCSSKTKKDCFRYNVLGLPATKRDLVQKIYKGMRLFLFDFDLRLMYGIYKAAGPGGYNIEPNAFKSAFPSQVRFTVLEDCLPLGEEKFKAAIKNNYFTKNKFDCQLTAEQVKNLCKLFTASGKGSKAKQVPRSVRAETRRQSDGDRTRPRPKPVDRDQTQPRPKPVGRDRTRPGPKSRRERPDGRRPTALVERRRPARHHHDRPTVYERETYRSPPPPLQVYQPLYQPAYPSYGRAPDIDAYSRDPIVERRDYRPTELDHRYVDETGGRDYYVSYREPPVYRDAVYPAEHSSLSELRPGYRLVAAPPPADYRLSAAPAADYRLSAAAPLEYDPYRVHYRY